MVLSFDRIAIEEVGSDPVKLARAVHRQLPDLTGAVPVHDIAYSLDILEIREERLNAIEACLLTDSHKSEGAILVNLESSRRRRRYSVGHELGHFLNERHRPTAEDGFRCTTDDLAQPKRSGQHLKQEREANTFAIELLAPERLIQRHLKRAADLEHALAIAEEMDISREAAVRRYVQLHEGCLAVVFSHRGRIRYIDKGKGFPATKVWAGDPVPALYAQRRVQSELGDMEEVSAAAWLSGADRTGLYTQTLHQSEQFAATLLLLDPAG